MANVVYALCAVTSFLCAFLLLKGYRTSGARLLLWSGLCFGFLTLNNILLFIDFSVVPEVDLSVWRTLPAVAGVGLLLFGLVWEA